MRVFTTNNNSVLEGKNNKNENNNNKNTVKPNVNYET